MKSSFCLFLIVLFSCNTNTTKKENRTAEKSAVSSSAEESLKEICWIGTVGKNIPVLIHYQIDQKVIIGEITYLNTTAKKAIKLLGTIEEDSTYRLLEFNTSGDITGIILGIQMEIYS